MRARSPGAAQGTVLILGLLLTGARALAAAPPGSWVVIAVGSCDDPNLGADTALVREALSRLLGSVVLSRDATQDRFGIFPVSPLERATAGLKEMQKHYVAADFSGAFDLAPAAEAALEHAAPTPDESAARRELSLLTVEALAHGGQEVLAQALLERLAELEPQTHLDPLRYPPSLERMWAVAKTHLAGQELEALPIAGPPGARVYLDGLAVGEAPVSLRVRSGEAFDLQVERGGLSSRHYPISPTSSAFVGALNLSDEARFRATPEACFDAQSLSTERAQGTLIRSLDVGGVGRFGTRPDLIENIVLVSLEKEGNELLSAALWSRAAAGVVRQAKIATVHGATNPDIASTLSQFVATGERTGADSLIVP